MIRTHTLFLLLAVLLLTLASIALGRDERDPRLSRSDSPRAVGITQPIAILSVNAGCVYVDSLN